MKKLNFDNQTTYDDKELVSLLKTSIRCEPSEEFVENTMDKFLLFKSKQRKIHKPLKSPLYMMLAIGLTLIISTLSSFNSQIFIRDQALEFENQILNIFSQFNPGYILSLMILTVALMSVIWIEFGLIKFGNSLHASRKHNEFK